MQHNKRDFLRDEWHFRARKISSGGDTGSKAGSGGQEERSEWWSEHQDGLGDQRTTCGSATTADGVGEGTKIRDASQGKEGFFCDECSSTSTPIHLALPRKLPKARK